MTRVLTAGDEPVTRETLASLDVGDWPVFKKTARTRAVRVEGPFSVVTVHQDEPIVCADGWLAVDAQGFPYPLADAEFRAIYEEVHMASDEGVPRPTIGRIVVFRSEKTNEDEGFGEPGERPRVAFEAAAIVTAVQASVWGHAVAAGHERDVTDDMHVHLVVFSPGDATFGGDAGGTWQEFNVPYDDVKNPRTWAWPTRQ